MELLSTSLSYTSVFEKLKCLNMIEPISQNYVDPRAKGFNLTIRCAYYSDAPGHNTKDCQKIRRKVEEMIQTKMIVDKNYDPPPPNLSKNPLPAHTNLHFIEIICDDKEHDNSLIFLGKNNLNC